MDWFANEKHACEQGFALVCGIDEAGRGPLAGPVYAAAVILPEGCEIVGLNDSKKLSEKKRDALFDIICEKAKAFAVASANVEEIEEYNILNATFLAMRRAVEEMPLAPDFALVDGNRMPPLPIPGSTIIGGDGCSASIAAASILAKVSRDRYMVFMDELYPQYGFAKHKGYGTAQHIQKILEHGACPIHRPSFLKKLYK